MMSLYENTPLSTAWKKMPGTRAITAIWAVFLLTVWCTGCVEIFGGITYYDPTTYKNMTDLKPEVLMLYDTYASDSVDMAKVSTVRLKLAQAYEYEKGKGDKNKETYEQISKIQGMFERHMAERMRDGKWNEANLSNKKENIGAAFDTAIRTERLKNKND